MDKTVESELEFTLEFDKIQVVNPVKSKEGKVFYMISGYDRLGYFCGIEKRYSDFYTFHEFLSERLKGLYIP